MSRPICKNAELGGFEKRAKRHGFIEHSQAGREERMGRQYQTSFWPS